MCEERNKELRVPLEVLIRSTSPELSVPVDITWKLASGCEF